MTEPRVPPRRWFDFSRHGKEKSNWLGDQEDAGAARLPVREEPA